MAAPQKLTSAAVFCDEVTQNLGLPVNMKGDIIRWIFGAQTNMKAGIAYEPRVALERVDGCKIKKPCDYVRLESLRIGSAVQEVSEGGETVVRLLDGVMPYFKPLVPSLARWGCGNCNKGWRGANGVFQVYERSYHFDISSDADGMWAEFRYDSYFDKEGYPMVDRAYQQSIEAFVWWCYVKRMRGVGASMATPVALRQAWVDFTTAKAQDMSRIKIEALTPDVLNQIGQMLNDPFFRSTNPLLDLNDFANQSAGVLGTGGSMGGFGFNGFGR